MLAAVRASAEKLAGIHQNWLVKLTDLAKEVGKYSDDLHKTHKRVKDEESLTSEAVKVIQEVTVSLQKSKEAYKQRCLELERLKRENGSAKELEKSEGKFRKAQEDYKALVDRYCAVREDFERKMTLSAKRFQDVEVSHLRQMREYVECLCRISDEKYKATRLVALTTGSHSSRRSM